MKILIFNSFITASPSPPTDFTVSDITSKSVMLHWGPPEKNGGSEITGTVTKKSERLKFKLTQYMSYSLKVYAILCNNIPNVISSLFTTFIIYDIINVTHIILQYCS